LFSLPHLELLGEFFFPKVRFFRWHLHLDRNWLKLEQIHFMVVHHWSPFWFHGLWRNWERTGPFHFIASGGIWFIASDTDWHGRNPFEPRFWDLFVECDCALDLSWYSVQTVHGVNGAIPLGKLSLSA
jgi:hypothetical protein